MSLIPDARQSGLDLTISWPAAIILVAILLIVEFFRARRWGYWIPRREWKDQSRWFAPQTMNPERHYTPEGEDRYYGQLVTSFGMVLLAIVGWLIADYLT